MNVFQKNPQWAAQCARKSHQLGRAHKWTHESGKQAGRKGGIQSGISKREVKRGRNSAAE